MSLNNAATLVRYDNPVLLTDVNRMKRSAKQPGAVAVANSGSFNSTTLGKTKGKPQLLPPVENKAQITQTEDILNSILPPRYDLLLSDLQS